MPRLLALVIAASIFVTSTTAFAAPALEHVRGTVKSISDTELVVHTTPPSRLSDLARQITLKDADMDQRLIS